MCAVADGKPGNPDRQLAPCPSRPNCVCSHATLPRHAIDPLPVPESLEDPFEQLVQLMRDWPRAQLVTQTANYLHMEVRTALFRFVDDVEFYWNADESLIHIRSASRLGYSDLGTNRHRLERIRHQFQQLT
ncbi:MAG TPA: DUF1499 domain-containing protein [Planctomycetaceae bacterium]|nr:DUF1499 domain-containing protein [Planctomycetaceae bacterium]